MRDANIAATIFNDFVGTASPYALLQPLYASGSAFPLTILPNGTAVGTANPRISMLARIYSYSPIAGGIGDAASFDVTFANASLTGLTYATA